MQYLKSAISMCPKTKPLVYLSVFTVLYPSLVEGSGKVGAENPLMALRRKLANSKEFCLKDPKNQDKSYKLKVTNFVGDLTKLDGASPKITFKTRPEDKSYVQTILKNTKFEKVQDKYGGITIPLGIEKKGKRDGNMALLKQLVDAHTIIPRYKFEKIRIPNKVEDRARRRKARQKKRRAISIKRFRKTVQDREEKRREQMREARKRAKRTKTKNRNKRLSRWRERQIEKESKRQEMKATKAAEREARRRSIENLIKAEKVYKDGKIEYNNFIWDWIIGDYKTTNYYESPTGDQKKYSGYNKNARKSKSEPEAQPLSKKQTIDVVVISSDRKGSLKITCSVEREFKDDENKKLSKVTGKITDIQSDEGYFTIREIKKALLKHAGFTANCRPDCHCYEPQKDGQKDGQKKEIEGFFARNIGKLKTFKDFQRESHLTKGTEFEFLSGE